LDEGAMPVRLTKSVLARIRASRIRASQPTRALVPLEMVLSNRYRNRSASVTFREPLCTGPPGRCRSKIISSS
jgi:hypothetical protein